MSTILEEIAEYKRNVEIPALLAEKSIHEIMQDSAAARPPLDFIHAIRNASGIALIAEIKKASPSRGLIRADFHPVKLAEGYEKGGADAISILTDFKYFQGSLDHFQHVRAACPNTPLLRKDFTVHPVQIYESRSAGADAILLIAAILSNQEINQFQQIAHSLGMAALIEVHNLEELERVLSFNPKLIGINNRDLHDFSVDVTNCLRLRANVPSGITLIAESGIHTPFDMAALKGASIDAALIGEAIVKTPVVEEKIKKLLAFVRPPASHIITTQQREAAAV